jgi:sugar diacid utilization regulator
MARRLVSAETAVQEQAARTLIEEGVVSSGRVVAVVAALGQGLERAPTDAQRLALDIALDHARRQLAPACALALTRPDHALLLSIWPGVPTQEAERHAENVAHAMSAQLRAELSPDELATCRIGVGGVREHLSAARESYEEALRTTRIAAATGEGASVTAYSGLGVYTLLAKLPLDELAESIHPGLRRLMAKDSGHPTPRLSPCACTFTAPPSISDCAGWRS